MFHRFSVGSSMQGITKGAIVAVAVTFIGAGAASAEKWKITLKSPKQDLKVDVYDVVGKKYLGKDKDVSKGLAVEAEAKKGGGSEPDKVGTHIRWQAKLNGKCWWGQVCTTKTGVEQSLGLLNEKDSKGAGNCKIEGDKPECGSEH